MGSFGPDKVVLPSGTTANRPSSPPNGFMRYNTDLYGVEMFTQAGWVIGGGAPGSENNPFSGTGTGLYNAGFTTTGNYWLNSTSTGPFEVRIVHDNGNGWINMTPTMGTMTNALTSGSGSGGSSFLQSPTLDPTSEMNNGTSTQSQANVYGCPGENGKAYLDLNSSFASDFSITEVRIKMYFVSGGNVICGPYWTNSTTQSSRVQLQGTTTQLNGACANPPNRYTDLVGSGFTVEWYGDISSSNRLLMSWTACGGSFGAQLKSIYVR